MSKSLIFVSGASSGIGLALVRTLPFGDARTIDISRRGAEGCEHFAADLADPADWRRVDELFDREIPDFSGERVIFIHSAGTLEPMGFAGEVDATQYTRNVLLNSAAPQVLGDAFLRAVARGRTNACLTFISSGAASSVYEGWTSYGAGKAAIDQWVRTVDKFIALHQDGELREPAVVARELWALIGRRHSNGAVLDLRDTEI